MVILFQLGVVLILTKTITCWLTQVGPADCAKFVEYHTLIGLMQNDRCDSADKVITSLYNLDDEHCRADVINQLASHFQHQIETPAYCYCNSSNKRDPIQHPEHHCYDHNADYKALFDQYFLNGTHHLCRSHHALWQVLTRIENGHRDCQTLLIELIAKAFSDHNMESCRCVAAPVEACLKHPCHNGGHCMASDHGNFTCNCTNGYHGHLCELTHCSSFPCQNNATCVPLSSGTYYKCECPVGYSGENCEVDNCSPSPCQHGYCVHSNNTKHFVCNCNHIYTGEHCEADLCHDCGTYGTCQWSYENKTAYCHCSPGYGGDHCGKVVDGCIHAPCRHGMQCNTADHWPYYTCHCDHGYLGDQCQHTHCTRNPCLHKGLCTPLTDGIFYKCNCSDGFSGVNCQVAPVTSAHDTIPTTTPSLPATTTKPPPTTTPTTTLIPSFTTTCSKLETVLHILEKKIETSVFATPCSSGNHSSHEAFVLNICHLGIPSTWRQGYNVMTFCDTIPHYTPIASFENGRYSSADSRSGIFVGYLHGPDGFKAAFQRCDEAAEFERILVGESMFNNNPYNYFTLEI